MNTFARRCIGLTLLACSTLLFGCDPTESEVAAAKLKTSPEIAQLGEFDGCQVSFVNRGYRDDSFYVAKCGNTATTTRQFRERQGKVSVSRTRAEITTQMAELAQEVQQLDDREKGMAKLSPGERKALGIRD